jgi:hypothetical protein
VIFDLFGQSRLHTSPAASHSARFAQGVSDARVHAARLPYLRLILPPRALPSLYVADNASALKSCSTGKPRNSLSLRLTSSDGAVTPLHALTTVL